MIKDSLWLSTCMSYYELNGGADEAEIRSQIDRAVQEGNIEAGILNAARTALLNPANRTRYDEQLIKQYAET